MRWHLVVEGLRLWLGECQRRSCGNFIQTMRLEMLCEKVPAGQCERGQKRFSTTFLRADGVMKRVLLVLVHRTQKTNPMTLKVHADYTMK